jgi:hypothetical protein
MQKLRDDPEFRKRFARAVSATLEEFGIDPASFAATKLIGEDQIARFLLEWAGRTGPGGWRAPIVEAEPPRPHPVDVDPLDPARPEELRREVSAAPTNVVYGPPPTPYDRRSEAKSGPEKLAPPTPVYGPPPGRSWLGRLFKRRDSSS